MFNELPLGRVAPKTPHKLTHDEEVWGAGIMQTTSIRYVRRWEEYGLK